MHSITPILLAVVMMIAQVCLAENITVDWRRNPTGVKNPKTPLRIEATQNDTLVFESNRPAHSVFMTTSRKSQLACKGTKVCDIDDVSCEVPLANVTDGKVWFFCKEHCPNQNVVVTLAVESSPTASPSASPTTSPSTAPAGERAPTSSPSESQE